MLPVTLNAVNVPTLVMLPCAAVVTVPAVVALVANGTVPDTLAPGMAVSPAPDPKYVEAVMLPDALSRPRLTLPVPFGVSTILALAADVCISNCAESTMAPLNNKLPAVMLPVLTVKLVPVMPAPVTAPVADIKPPVRMLPPVTLPVSDAVVPVCVVALTLAPPRMLPPVILPVTLNNPSVPTDVKLEFVTLDDNVLPVSVFALTVVIIPLS